MQQIRATLGLATITILLCSGNSVAAPSQVSVTHDVPKSGKQLEFTEVDVFATQKWSAEDISVIGFHLGMNRADAVENARKRSLNLIASIRGDSAPCSVSNCTVCDQQNVLCDGIGVDFGKDNRIERIYIGPPLLGSPQDLRRASVTQQFKGQTYLFFHSYSNALRLKLFGPESSRQEDRSMWMKYSYPRLGMEVDVDLSSKKRIPENKAGLSVDFVHPKPLPRR
jgi:hypothetical protein